MDEINALLDEFLKDMDGIIQNLNLETETSPQIKKKLIAFQENCLKILDYTVTNFPNGHIFDFPKLFFDRSNKLLNKNDYLRIHEDKFEKDKRNNLTATLKFFIGDCYDIIEWNNYALIYLDPKCKHQTPPSLSNRREQKIDFKGDGNQSDYIEQTNDGKQLLVGLVKTDTTTKCTFENVSIKRDNEIKTIKKLNIDSFEVKNGNIVFGQKKETRDLIQWLKECRDSCTKIIELWRNIDLNQ